MEKAKNEIGTKIPFEVKSSSIYKKIVLNMLKQFTIGELHLELSNGENLIIGEGNGLKVDIKVKDTDFYRRCVLYGDIGFGEAYCDGFWETSNLTNVIRWVIQNIETSGVMSGSRVKNMATNLLGQINRIGHIFKKNSKKGSQSNISYHYDLSNDFYQLMLDETMSYSCGIFKNPDTTLQEAQVNKLEYLCDDLDIRPGDHILEVGCGWGGFAIHAVRNYDCKVTGITISKEQYNFSLNKVKELALEDKITVLLTDYRELNGKYDKIISVEMIEAVGHEFLPEYFKTIDKLLKKDGVAVVQAITSPDSRYDQFRKGVDFIQKHIFPGTLLPSINSMTMACVKETELQIYNLRDIGLHYAKTLEHWRETCFEEKDKILNLGMDETFFKKWNYYLCYCEAAFQERNISDIQITFIKPNNTSYKIDII
jgi:cyclopropane-fatty-acyl-phospholipid synthase